MSSAAETRWCLLPLSVSVCTVDIDFTVCIVDIDLSAGCDDRDAAGTAPDPGHELSLDPCLCNVPSFRCSLNIDQHVGQVPKSFGSFWLMLNKAYEVVQQIM